MFVVDSRMAFTLGAPACDGVLRGVEPAAGGAEALAQTWWHALPEKPPCAGGPGGNTVRARWDVLWVMRLSQHVLVRVVWSVLERAQERNVF